MKTRKRNRVQAVVKLADKSVQSTISIRVDRIKTPNLGERSDE